MQEAEEEMRTCCGCQYSHSAVSIGFMKSGSGAYDQHLALAHSRLPVMLGVQNAKLMCQGVQQAMTQSRGPSKQRSSLETPRLSARWWYVQTKQLIAPLPITAELAPRSEMIHLSAHGQYPSLLRVLGTMEQIIGLSLWGTLLVSCPCTPSPLICGAKKMTLMLMSCCQRMMELEVHRFAMRKGDIMMNKLQRLHAIMETSAVLHYIEHTLYAHGRCVDFSCWHCSSFLR